MKEANLGHYKIYPKKNWRLLIFDSVKSLNDFLRVEEDHATIHEIIAVYGSKGTSYHVWFETNENHMGLPLEMSWDSPIRKN